MKMLKKFFTVLLIMFVAAAFAACGAKDKDNNSIFKTNVLIPQSPGSIIHENKYAAIDASNTSQGYIMVKYKINTDKKIKAQVIKNGETYTYDLPAGSEHYSVLPLTQGSGEYRVKIYTNIRGSEYALSYQKSIDVELADEFLPFLYPNEYVYFTSESAAVKKAAQLAKKAGSELDVVSAIYNYTVKNIKYDYEKAKTVKSGYVPDIDEILSTKKGICFDYASLMCGMLRSLGIPTKLIMGYVGDIYHAWISVYVKDIGWVNNIIEFDGKNWKIMDPTFDSTSKSDREVVKKINEGADYTEKYAY